MLKKKFKTPFGLFWIKIIPGKYFKYQFVVVFDEPKLLIIYLKVINCYYVYEF